MSRFALTPRAALVLAGLVVVVALVVVLVGTVRSGAGATATVTGAPAVPGSGPGSAGSGAGSSGSGAAGRQPLAPDSTGPSGTPDRSGGTATPTVVVHVLGAVERPGVETLPATSRVTDALAAAGGAAADADLARLNLARPLVDGERLYVPRVGEVDVPQAIDGPASGSAPAAGAGPGSASAADAVVDLNTADQAALETLPGVGPALAGRILAWRDEHGRFTAVDDLLDVSGIGDARFAELRERVRV